MGRASQRKGKAHIKPHAEPTGHGTGAQWLWESGETRGPEILARARPYGALRVFGFHE